MGRVGQSLSLYDCGIGSRRHCRMGKDDEVQREVLGSPTTLNVMFVLWTSPKTGAVCVIFAGAFMIFFGFINIFIQH